MSLTPPGLERNFLDSPETTCFRDGKLRFLSNSRRMGFNLNQGIISKGAILTVRLKRRPVVMAMESSRMFVNGRADEGLHKKTDCVNGSGNGNLEYYV